MTRFLIKDSDDLLSFCKCDTGLVGVPGQLDCPWCGCGWMLSCIDCRKSFVFARCPR
ncbi:MAG TPA: hypothetical protein QGF58_19085 [Myxococcota bacterium]|nr:hypothetical protein [Myxococcota bacterium]